MIDMKNKARRGRPRAFDRDAALAQAMQVFRATGYAATSIPMLVDAMGISAQSLYAAFVSKEALYREALALYGRTVGDFATRALAEEDDVFAAVARMLRDAATVFSQTADAPGCMVTMAPADTTDDPLVVLGRQVRAEGVERVATRLAKGVADGQLPADFPCDDWAHYLGSVVQGMSVQARDGASEAALRVIADIAAASFATHRRP